MAANRGPDRTITFFADYVCPFSYLSLRGLEAAAAAAGARIERRAFELRPPGVAPLEPMGDDEWRVVSELAGAHDVAIKRPDVWPRTRKAHEAVKLAATLNKEADLERAIFDAYFLIGRDIGRIDVLVDIGKSVGIDPMALKVALDVDVHTVDVVRDEALAEELEIQGTPAFVAGSDVRVGYLSPEHLMDWLKG